MSKKLSINNGQSLILPCDLTDEQIDQYRDAMIYAMDGHAREQAHAQVAPCTDREFLQRYLELAPTDLVIG
jgi:hypothetical protein